MGGIAHQDEWLLAVRLGLLLQLRRRDELLLKVAHVCKKTVSFLRGFPMLVPSLSW